MVLDPEPTGFNQPYGEQPDHVKQHEYRMSSQIQCHDFQLINATGKVNFCMYMITHDMEKFSTLLAPCKGIHQARVDSATIRISGDFRRRGIWCHCFLNT